MKVILAIVLMVIFTTLSSVTHAQSLWSMYEPGCNSSGIAPETCRCSMDEVVEAHGEAAARYVGLEMILRYDEASALKEQIGEDKAYAAGAAFEAAQYKECAAGRLARLKGTYESAGASATTQTADSSADAAGAPMSAETFQNINVFAANAPVIDLRQMNGEVIADVSANFNDASLLTGGANSSLKNFLGFYRVADLEGGIDTNGDGLADVRPGDDEYSAEVQKRSMPKKLYVSEHGGAQQVLGEAQFQGGEMYAFYVRMKGDRSKQRLMGSVNTANKPQSMEDLLRTMQTPQHLFFVFPAANPNGSSHIVALGNSVFRFSVLPMESASADDHDDAQITFSFGM